MNHITPETNPIRYGKYRITTLTAQGDDGRFRPSVSIQSGTGRASHDRIYRFIPSFESAESAARYALDQAMSWLRAPSLSHATPI
jgi:hypothetical protein